MDFLKKLPNRIKSYLGNKEKRKYFIIISAAVIALAALPFTLRGLQERSSYSPVYPQTPPPAFEGFLQMDRTVDTLESTLSLADRFVRVTILREMDPEEYASIPGIVKSRDELPKDENGKRLRNEYKYIILSQLFNEDGSAKFTYFEATVTYDYDIGRKANEKIIIPYGGTHKLQIYGEPIYQPGDEYVMLLEKLGPPEASLYRFGSIFDVLKSDEGEFLYKRSDSFQELKSMPMLEGESKRVTSTKENPAHYSQKFKLEDFITIVKQKRIEVKSKGSSKSEPAGTQ